VALSYSVHFLIAGKSFKESLEWVISQKGDTDTNGCIMGGLVGAYYGVKELKMESQIEKIRSWNAKKRPEWLNPGKVVPQFIIFLNNVSHSELKMIGSTNEYPSFTKK
jgi:ADP-ribosyl-[dinitrogen reductase] hydrolase